MSRKVKQRGLIHIGIQYVAEDVIIVGASVRAAAWSAIRAGLTPWAVDLFADRDLCRVARAKALDSSDYPHGIVKALQDAPPSAAWMYTGGLENRPGLVERIARRLALWGNPATVLRRVRSPFMLAQVLATAGLRVPQVTRQPDDSCRWLMKPIAGAGGRGIHFWDGKQPLRAGHYFQEWIDGMACAAVYVGHAAGQSQFIGATRQLVGRDLPPWNQSRADVEFDYAGSIGPLALDAAANAVFRKLGDTLVHAFGLRGPFGVDCVLRDGVPWVVEVNPRYTASMEILEWAFRAALLKCFCKGAMEPPGVTPPSEVLGKLVVRADRESVFPEVGPWDAVFAAPWLPWEIPAYADIPSAGQRFDIGQPILTVFARGTSEATCLEKLLTMARASK